MVSARNKNGMIGMKKMKKPKLFVWNESTASLSFKKTEGSAHICIMRVVRPYRSLSSKFFTLSRLVPKAGKIASSHLVQAASRPTALIARGRIFSWSSTNTTFLQNQLTAMASSTTSSNAHMHTNRLANEESPYLLQHAHNPVSAGVTYELKLTSTKLLGMLYDRLWVQVDWFPWGQEAFDKAQAEDKPIYLSVGYRQACCGV